MYLAEPCDGLTPAQCGLVLGGGAEMWGENVDASDVLASLWPRLGAVGERLWSPANITSLAAAEPRLAWLRCLLNQRGVAAAPLLNLLSRSAPPGPGSCYKQ